MKTGPVPGATKKDMSALLHIATPSGHLAPSARHEIEDEALTKLIRPLLAALSTRFEVGTVLDERHRLKAEEGSEALLTFRVETTAGDFLMIGFVYREASTSAVFWESFRSSISSLPPVPPTPWLFVIANPEAADEHLWLEAFTYTLAWCWLEQFPTSPRQEPAEPQQWELGAAGKVAGLLSGSLLGLFLMRAAYDPRPRPFDSWMHPSASCLCFILFADAFGSTLQGYDLGRVETWTTISCSPTPFRPANGNPEN